MKNKLLIVAFFISVLTVKAQINLEHTFAENVYPFNTNNGTYYYGLSSKNTLLKIFNPDYSLYKFITLTPPTGYGFSNVLSISKTLFNSDDRIEFIVVYNQLSDFYSYSMKLYNENLDLLKDFGNRMSAYVNMNSSNKIKLNVLGMQLDNKTSSFNYITDIYSLPGSLPNGQVSLKSEKLEQPYPNPSNSTINLPYKLDNGKTSLIRIYDINGLLIEQKQIDSAFDKIMLDIRNYKSGVYIYEFNGLSNRFIVN